MVCVQRMLREMKKRFDLAEDCYSNIVPLRDFLDSFPFRNKTSNNVISCRNQKYDQFNGTLKCAYTYLADGTKVMVQDNANSSSSNGYLYLGSMVFRKTGTSYAFESTDFGGGRIINVNGTLSPYYYTTDHLGSVRVITDASGNVTERNDYYAFGKRMTTGNTYPTTSSNRWKYNGKEVQTTGNVNWLDYGAREYDEVTGRWTRPDPMSEKYYGTSGYTYCLNNPISFIDVKGCAPGDFFRTIIAAAKDFGKTFNDNSIRLNREFGSTIYVAKNSKGEYWYSYSVPNIGSGESSVYRSLAPDGTTPVAGIHSHGADSNGKYYDDGFSGDSGNAKQNMSTTYGDVGGSNSEHMASYLVTPNGSLKKYNPDNGNVTLVSTQMPSDEKSQTRVNSIGLSPSTSKYKIKKGNSLVDIANIFKTSAKAIIKENSIKNDLKIGQILNITN